MKEAVFPNNLCLNKLATAPNPTASVDLINRMHSFVPILWPRSVFSTISPMSDFMIKSCARPIFLNTSTLLNWVILFNPYKPMSTPTSNIYVVFRLLNHSLLSNIQGATNALERALAGEELSFQDGLQLLREENLFSLAAAADMARNKTCGNTVTFTSSYYLNYTNVCAASCPLCAFYRQGDEDDAYTLTIEQIVTRAGIAVKQMGAKELHIVGGFHPKLGLGYYEAMMKAIKMNYPDVTIKALTPAEIFFIAKLTRNSVKEVLLRLKDAGLDTLPGGGAEIFGTGSRDRIVRGKCSGEEWLNTAQQAHELGLTSNSTMLFGHIEKLEDIVDHVLKIRELHKKTNGFNTFIPLKFSLDNTELEQNGTITMESPSTYDLRIIAVSRLLLSNVLNNISIYWVALGKKLAQVALSYGGNDLVGTAFSEEIFKASGKGAATSIEELINLIREVKKEPALRDSYFNIIKKFAS